jgi:hypothetical protein
VEGTYALVRRALEERLQVHATYDGYRRRMCPHIIGTKEGRPRALFFQFAGGSSRGLLSGGDWRCLLLDDLTDISVHVGAWHTRARSEPQHCVDEVDLEIDPESGLWRGRWHLVGDRRCLVARQRFCLLLPDVVQRDLQVGPHPG